jgi:membrane associated rhomboid family serine protease
MSYQKRFAFQSMNRRVTRFYSPVYSFSSMLSYLASQVLFLVIVILSAVITASAGLSNLASLDISLVMSGEVWRLFTGHLTHLTWRHYALNAPVFFIVYLVYRRNTGGLSSIYLAISSAIIVSATVVFIGIHQVYGGLSGLSCAAISAILLKMILDAPRRIFPYILIFAFLVYLLFLQGNASGINVAKEAHVAGTISGLTFEWVRRWLTHSNSNTHSDVPEV